MGGLLRLVFVDLQRIDDIVNTFVNDLLELKIHAQLEPGESRHSVLALPVKLCLGTYIGEHKNYDKLGLCGKFDGQLSESLSGGKKYQIGAGKVIHQLKQN